jgi:hypothetical protein
MNFLGGLLGGGGGGGGGVSASSNSSGTSAGDAGGNVGLQSKDLVWIAVAFAGALVILGLLWIAFKKN